MKKHTLMMLACLAIPIALLVAVYGFGIRSPIVYWAALLMCPLIHIVMMKLDKGKSCH